MMKYSEADGKLTLKVQVVPRASRSEIVGEQNGALRVRIAAPPVEGAANEELVKMLSRELKISRGSIAIIAGKRSKLKHLRVTGVDPNVLDRLRKLGKTE